MNHKKVYILCKDYYERGMDVKKKTIITIIVTLTLAGTSVPAGYVYATEQNWSKVIYPEIYIKDINVGGKEISQAESLIRENYERPLLSKKIQIKAGEKIYTLDYDKLQIKYNVSDVVQEAFNYGKERNILERYKLIKGAEKKQFNLKFSYNTKAIDELIDEIDKDMLQNPENALISINKGEIKITPEKDGIKLKRDELMQRIINEINDELNIENALIEAPVEITKPSITEEKLSAIDAAIASFSTSFSTSTANRINNIELATKAIDGTLLMPGESFSFNETVGERTAARGYKAAGVIIGDKIESGIGGGICQVSSTLYNAVLKSNIKVLERRNHSLPLSYIGKGLDATVDWGNIDFRFQNSLDVPIYIEGYTKDKKVYFNIYSSKELTKRTYEMTTDVYDTVQPTVKYINDSNLPEGNTRVVKNASKGYKVKVYRKTYENGKLINTELISSDYYRPVNGEIIIGTKKSS